VKQSWRWVIGGLAVALVAAVAAAAWYVFGDSAPAKPKLSASAPTDTSGRTTPDGAWHVVDGKSVYVGYRMTEVFAGDIVHKTAVGRTPAVSGTMTIARNTVTAAAVTGQMQQLTSNRGARDNYIHSHAIETDTFPTATFTLTKPIPLPAPPVAGKQITVNATGTLDLHGVTKAVTVPLQARWDGDTIEVVGSLPIKLADYAITPPDTGVVKVDDHGSMELSLVFAPLG
jgi:polyisoprenoid-binding protein YceI